MRNAYNHPRGLIGRFGGDHAKGGGQLPEVAGVPSPNGPVAWDSLFHHIPASTG